MVILYEKSITKGRSSFRAKAVVALDYQSIDNRSMWVVDNQALLQL